MENLHRLETDTLVDLLSTQTDAYFRMQKVGAKEEDYARCRLLLRALQKEIDLRRKKELDTRLRDEETLID